MNFTDSVQKRLAALRDAHLLRSPRILQGPQAPVMNLAGKPTLCFCSNDYLGFAGHPDLAGAIAEASAHVGAGAAASRHISGTAPHHREAEIRLASHVRRPAALLFSSGYAANVGTIQALVGPGDIVFSDELNHASLIDGMRLSRAQVVVYPHRDLQALAGLLETHRKAARVALVVTDAIFSMDGDQADLPGLAALCEHYDAALMVDEAHSVGVFGPQGAGLCVQQGVVPDVLIGTLGKAFGLAGAFVAGEEDTVRLIENRARSYVFSTAPPPALAAATLVACDLVANADDRRQTLSQRTAQLADGLRALGYPVLASDSAVIPLLVGAPDRVMALSAALLEHGVFVHGIRPPTVPEGGSRLRVTAMATHTEQHVEQALAAFAAVRPLLDGRPA